MTNLKPNTEEARGLIRSLKQGEWETLLTELLDQLDKWPDLTFEETQKLVTTHLRQAKAAFDADGRFMRERLKERRQTTDIVRVMIVFGCASTIGQLFEFDVVSIPKLMLLAILTVGFPVTAHLSRTGTGKQSWIAHHGATLLTLIPLALWYLVTGLPTTVESLTALGMGWIVVVLLGWLLPYQLQSDWLKKQKKELSKLGDSYPLELETMLELLLGDEIAREIFDDLDEDELSPVQWEAVTWKTAAH